MTLTVVGFGKNTCLAIVAVVCAFGLSCGIFNKTAVSPAEFSQDSWLAKAVADSEKAGDDLVKAANTNSGETGLGIVAASRKDMPAAASALASAARQDAESVAKIIVAVDPKDSTSFGDVVLEAARKDTSSMGIALASAARYNTRAVGKIVSLVMDKDTKTAADIIIVGAQEDSEALGAALADCAITNSQKTGAAFAMAAASAPEVTGAAIAASLKVDPGSVSNALVRSSALDPAATAKALVSGTFFDPVALSLLGERISSDAWMPEVVPEAGGDILAGPEWKASLPSDDSVPISGILTRFDQAPEDAGIEISRLEPDVRDSREGRTVHSYVKLNPADFDNDDVMVARVAFNVEKSWLEGMGLHRWSVEFSRFSESIGSWQPVTAKYLNEDETHIHYSVPVSGFSEWSISGSPSVKPPVPVSDVVFATAAVSGGAYMSALAEVENTGSYPVDRSLSLWIDSQVHSSQTVTIPAGETVSVDFRATVGYGSHNFRVDRFSRMVSFALPENPASFNTPAPSPTYTSVPVSTPTPSPTYTSAPTSTPTSSPTYTPMPTSTPTSSPTYTPMPTSIPMPSPTYTSVPTNTSTPGNDSLQTSVKLLTQTATSTLTPLPTKIAVELPTVTPNLVSTSSPVGLLSSTPTPTNPPTPTLTATSIPSVVSTPVPPTTSTQSIVIASAPASSPPTATPAPTATPTPVAELDTKDSLPDGVPEYMRNVWLCTNGSAPGVDDLTTNQSENNRCVVEVEYTDEFAVVTSNGIPNHDYESTLGCCAAEIDYEWKIPLSPQNAQSVAYAPERGAVAVSVNGVPFFGPEDGPGGDAVAFHHGYYEEDRQQIVLGLCGAHSAGTVFHYHFDGNCVHWHPEEQGKNWIDWMMDLVRSDEPSPVIGFAFDGYPIYGPFGYGVSGNLQEMRSSYRLKEGNNGYGGIDDWEYVPGLGDLDECNGISSPIRGISGDIYHYHSTKMSGSGDIGFPYFILCYSGVPETSNYGQGGGQGPGGAAGGQGAVGGPGQPVGGQIPNCLPSNPPPGMTDYPPQWSELDPCTSGNPLGVGPGNSPDLPGPGGGQMPQCKPANPPAGMTTHPPEVQDLPPCPDPQPGQGQGGPGQGMGGGQMPQCKPPNPPPGMNTYPPGMADLPPCPDPQPGQGQGGPGQGMGGGQMPQCKPPNPPPGMNTYPPGMADLTACQPGQVPFPGGGPVTPGSGGSGQSSPASPTPAPQPAGPGYVGLAPHANVIQGTAGYYGSPVGYGVVIAGVAPGGPAANAGISSGDVIVSMGGTKITNIDSLIAFLNANGPGSTGSVGIYRNGQYVSLTITLGLRP